MKKIAMLVLAMALAMPAMAETIPMTKQEINAFLEKWCLEHPEKCEQKQFRIDLKPGGVGSPSFSSGNINGGDGGYTPDVPNMPDITPDTPGPQRPSMPTLPGSNLNGMDKPSPPVKPDFSDPPGYQNPRPALPVVTIPPDYPNFEPPPRPTLPPGKPPCGANPPNVHRGGKDGVSVAAPGPAKR